MKKIIRNISLVAILAAMFISCSSTNSNKKMETKKELIKPQYLIKVEQDGKLMGEILIELYGEAAPKHTANFDSLVAAGAYNGTAFHRVIPNFMIQGGDPNSIHGPRETWGQGSPNQTRVPAEFSKTLNHKRGIISAARTPDPNSASSQFFICVTDVPHLDGQYSIFGEVVRGMDVVDRIVNSPRDKNDNPLNKISMKISRVE